MAIYERIKYYRKRSSLTQSQLAALIGVSPQAVSKWETGTGSPDISLLVPLARTLGITTDELLEFRPITDLDAMRDEWDHMALAYEQFNNAPDSYSYCIEWPCIQQLLPELKGKKILDLGCGTGIFTFLLETYYPDKIVGIDLSEEMLKLARAKAAEKRSRAKFLQGDVQKLTEIPDDTYDLVFSSTTTHYLTDLSAFFKTIHKAMKQDGSCILSVIHPVYSAQYPIEHGDTFPTEEEWSVRYLDKRRRAYIQPWIEYNDDFENHLSRSYHYTMGDYLQAALEAGLKLETLQEPMPPESWKTASFGRYDGYMETPVYLIVKLTK